LRMRQEIEAQTRSSFGFNRAAGWPETKPSDSLTKAVIANPS
jgi:hypothetical protein